MSKSLENRSTANTAIHHHYGYKQLDKSVQINCTKFFRLSFKSELLVHPFLLIYLPLDDKASRSCCFNGNIFGSNIWCCNIRQTWFDDIVLFDIENNKRQN